MPIESSGYSYIHPSSEIFPEATPSELPSSSTSSNIEHDTLHAAASEMKQRPALDQKIQNSRNVLFRFGNRDHFPLSVQEAGRFIDECHDALNDITEELHQAKRAGINTAPVPGTGPHFLLDVHLITLKSFIQMERSAIRDAYGGRAKRTFMASVACSSQAKKQNEMMKRWKALEGQCQSLRILSEHMQEQQAARSPQASRGKEIPESSVPHIPRSEGGGSLSPILESQSEGPVSPVSTASSETSGSSISREESAGPQPYYYGPIRSSAIVLADAHLPVLTRDWEKAAVNADTDTADLLAWNENKRQEVEKELALPQRPLEAVHAEKKEISDLLQQKIREFNASTAPYDAMAAEIENMQDAHDAAEQLMKINEDSGLMNEENVALIKKLIAKISPYQGLEPHEASLRRFKAFLDKELNEHIAIGERLAPILEEQGREISAIKVSLEYLDAEEHRLTIRPELEAALLKYTKGVADCQEKLKAPIARSLIHEQIEKARRDPQQALAVTARLHSWIEAGYFDAAYLNKVLQAPY